MSIPELAFKGFIQNSKNGKGAHKNLRIIIELYENGSTPKTGAMIKAHEMLETPFLVTLTKIPTYPTTKPEPKLESTELSAEWSEAIKELSRINGQKIEYVRETWRARMSEKYAVEHFRELNEVQGEDILSELKGEIDKIVIPN